MKCSQYISIFQICIHSNILILNEQCVDGFRFLIVKTAQVKSFTELKKINQCWCQHFGNMFLLNYTFNNFDFPFLFFIEKNKKQTRPRGNLLFIENSSTQSKWQCTWTKLSSVFLRFSIHIICILVYLCPRVLSLYCNSTSSHLFFAASSHIHCGAICLPLRSFSHFCSLIHLCNQQPGTSKPLLPRGSIPLP